MAKRKRVPRAKEHGTCSRCGSGIKPGHAISWSRRGVRRTWHIDCSDPSLGGSSLEDANDSENVTVATATNERVDRDLLRRTDASFTRWQREMVFEPKIHGKWDKAPSTITGPIQQRQTDLIDAVTDGPDKLALYLRIQLQLAHGKKIEALPFPRRALTPNEYREPPVELEKELGQAWNSVLERRPALASRPLFWLLCHVAWIKEGRIGDNGLSLEEALLSGRDAREARIRNFLRRTGGLPHVRGNTSVFSDCPLARAWWRFYLAGEVEKTSEGQLDRETVHRLFHRHRQSWETLVMLSLKRITAINQPRARAMIARYLQVQLQTNGQFDQSDVRVIATALARLSLRRSLDHTPLKELHEMLSTTSSLLAAPVP